MISKETFCNIINHIENMELMANDMNAVFNMHTTNDFFDGAAFIDFELTELTVKAICEDLDDTEDWITWWMYDTKFGTDGTIVFKTYNGVKKSYNLDSAAALYDFLIGELVPLDNSLK